MAEVTSIESDETRWYQLTGVETVTGVDFDELRTGNSWPWAKFCVENDGSIRDPEGVKLARDSVLERAVITTIGKHFATNAGSLAGQFARERIGDPWTCLIAVCRFLDGSVLSFESRGIKIQEPSE